jgi:RNA polymerase sigma-70 factor (ECF subfamily)
MTASANQDPAPRDTEEPAEPDWSALMARSQEGDGAAYRRLLQSILPYLRALARRAGLPGDEVEDAVQDVLMTLHAIRHSYDPARPFAPWLAAVARHRIIDRRRRLVRRASRESPMDNETETLPAPPTYLPETESEVRRMKAAISALPKGQRQAIEMLKLKEMSLKEASAASGQSISALKVAVHRAVKRLRSLLAED